MIVPQSNQKMGRGQQGFKRAEQAYRVQLQFVVSRPRKLNSIRLVCSLAVDAGDLNYEIAEARATPSSRRRFIFCIEVPSA
jgi:hypothetical protein